MIDTKHGFIVTYFQTNDDSLKVLESTISALETENYYLILSSHSPVPVHIQEKCDYVIVDNLNIIDDRKYSHGVAENILIRNAFLHLKENGIEWTYKMSYDVNIVNVNVFDDWIQGYKYNFVTCKWGDCKVSTHSFFANINFILDNIKFYKSIEDMFTLNTVLEHCWEKNISDMNLWNSVYSYGSKSEFFKENAIDCIYYPYDDIVFTYGPEQNMFHIYNNSNTILHGNVKIIDYYTESSLQILNNVTISPGTSIWCTPPDSIKLNNSTNGYYMIFLTDNAIIRKNILVNDFYKKHPFSKKMKSLQCNPKFNEFCEFNSYSLYKKFNLNFDNINVYVDIGANFGFSAMPFIARNKSVYLIDADPFNIQLLNKNYSKYKNIKIIDKVIYNLDGKVEFLIIDNDDGHVTSAVMECRTDLNATKNLSVDAITPNTLLENYIIEADVDLMKIDIEGAEYEFFNTITDTNLKRIKNIILEFHNNIEYKVKNIIKKLAKNGFNYEFDVWGPYNNSYALNNYMGIIYAKRNV